MINYFNIWFVPDINMVNRFTTRFDIIAIKFKIYILWMKIKTKIRLKIID